MPPPDPSRARVRRRNPIQRTLGLPLCLALLAAEAPVSAAPVSPSPAPVSPGPVSPGPVSPGPGETPDSDKTPETPDTPEVARANHYVAQADAKAALGEDVEAAQLYITALEQLADPADQRVSRGMVMAKIVGALLRAADNAVDPETSWAHLCDVQARLDDFIAALEEHYGPTSPYLPEIESAQEQATRITTRLSRFGDPQVLCASDSATSDDHEDPEGSTEQSNGDSEDAPQQPPEPVEQPKTKTSHPGRGLTIAGSFSLSLGAAAGGLMGYALYSSEQNRNLVTNVINTIEAEQRPATAAEYDSVAEWTTQGFRANRIALASGLTGGVALIAGVTMIAVGRRRHRLSRLALTPMLQPSSAGLRLSGRF